MSFIHLRVHTEYSLSDSIIRVNELVDHVAKMGMPGVAVTDLQNLHCAVKFYTKSLQRGLKPIIGVEVLIENQFQPESPYLLVLLCQNLHGYRSLCNLLTRAQTDSQKSGELYLKKKWLTAGACKGMIGLSGAHDGEIGNFLLQGNMDEARIALREYRDLFPDRFYLDIARIGHVTDKTYEDAALDLAELTKTPVVATHSLRFLKKEEFGVHEIKVCIHDRTEISDPRRRKDFSNEQYLKSPSEMTEIFADLPQAIENSLEIAKRCNFQFNLKRTLMPAYPLQDKSMEIDDHLRMKSEDGLKNLMNEAVPEHYWQRLSQELEIIKKTDYAGYFLIVADIINWAKSEGIQVGPGRGSGAGSLVAYALYITTIDPIEYGLIFERFLNPDRISPPDFDVDFCVEERDRVIDYVSKRYGKEQVAQIVTYNTMAARAAVRDVGRAIRPDYLYYDGLAKLIPRELDITLRKALSKVSELNGRYESEPRMRELFDTARKLEGTIKNVSKHPGGIVISPTRITDYSALFLDRETGRDVTQFDKDDLEKIGLVKFDFLGLTTLTIIAHTLRSINSDQSDGKPLKLQDIPLDDKKTLDYICTGRTVGIFQLESKGMRRLIHSMQPTEFNDLVALLALFRPGPLQNNMDQLYINNRKFKKYKILHEDLKDILDSSHGVILYQEQVMKIAQVMSGYSLGEADILRRAMGKKLKDEMKIQRERFVDGALEKGYKGNLATKIYDLIESFGGYGFNKSHSVAYALLAYQTAYFKTHYLAKFLAACMTVDFKVESVAKKIHDATRHGIEVIPPDINRSEYQFKAISENQILYGLCAIKKVGNSASGSIEKSRNQGDRFQNISDFCMRIDLEQVSKSSCQALIEAGAFDRIDSNRAAVWKQLDSAYGTAQQHALEQKSGQANLFSVSQISLPTLEQVPSPPWPTSEKLRREYSVLGLYLSGHPFDRYQQELKTLPRTISIRDVKKASKSKVVVGGWIVNRQIVDVKNRSGRNMYFELQDRSGMLSVVAFSEVSAKFIDSVKDNVPVIVYGNLEEIDQGGEIRLVASKILNFPALRALPQVKVQLNLHFDRVKVQDIRRLKSIIGESPDGDHEILVQYFSESGSSAQFPLTDRWLVTISDDLLDAFKNIFGEDCVLVDYSKVSLEYIQPDNQSIPSSQHLER